MIVITITVEEVKGELITKLESKSETPTGCEQLMANELEHNFKVHQKKMARRAGGRYIPGKR